MVIPLLDPTALQRVCDKCIKAPFTPAKVSLAGGLDSLVQDDSASSAGVSEVDSAAGTPERRRSGGNLGAAAGAGDSAHARTMPSSSHSGNGENASAEDGSDYPDGSNVQPFKLNWFLKLLILWQSAIMLAEFFLATEVGRPYQAPYHAAVQHAQQTAQAQLQAAQLHPLFLSAVSSVVALESTEFVQRVRALLQAAQVWAADFPVVRNAMQAVDWEANPQYTAWTCCVVAFFVLRVGVGGAARKRADGRVHRGRIASRG